MVGYNSSSGLVETLTYPASTRGLSIEAALRVRVWHPAASRRFQRSGHDLLAGKLRDLQYKLLATVGVEERVATNSLLCTVAEIDRVLKDRSSADVFDGEKFKGRYAERVPEFISHAALYCHCKIQQLEEQARGFVSSSSSCGPQPELE